MELAGYFTSVLIGISLGLIGGGGSILTVPVLVYLFGLDAIAATAYSLFIVGSTSLVGAFYNLKKGNIDLKIALIFAAPSLLAVYSVRRFLMPVLPNDFDLLVATVDKDIFILLFFAIIMLVAAIQMIRPGKPEQESKEKTSIPYFTIAAEGLGVGAITGFVGAGGGFLIIPALVLLVGMSMKRAVATSLLIISIKSLVGFIGDVQNFEVDWNLLLTVGGLAILGIFIGMRLNQKINGEKLKTGFGWFVLIMAIFMIAGETI